MTQTQQPSIVPFDLEPLALLDGGVKTFGTGIADLTEGLLRGETVPVTHSVRSGLGVAAFSGVGAKLDAMVSRPAPGLPSGPVYSRAVWQQ